MSLRTASDLNTIIQRELGWRRKEIRAYRQLVETSVDFRKTSLLRGAVTVLYAHWEGAIKQIGETYLKFVRSQMVTNKELSSPFFALLLKHRLTELLQSSKADGHIKLVEYLRSSQDEPVNLPNKRYVDTNANLKVDVFKNIVVMLGLEYRKEYLANEKPTIERLLELRNGIAHGEYQDVEETEYKQIQERIEEMMLLFANDVVNAAATNQYRK